MKNYLGLASILWAIAAGPASGIAASDSPCLDPSFETRLESQLRCYSSGDPVACSVFRNMSLVVKERAVGVGGFALSAAGMLGYKILVEGLVDGNSAKLKQNDSQFKVLADRRAAITEKVREHIKSTAAGDSARAATLTAEIKSMMGEMVEAAKQLRFKGFTAVAQAAFVDEIMERTVRTIRAAVQSEIPAATKQAFNALVNDMKPASLKAAQLHRADVGGMRARGAIVAPGLAGGAGILLAGPLASVWTSVKSQGSAMPMGYGAASDLKEFVFVTNKSELRLIPDAVTKLLRSPKEAEEIFAKYPQFCDLLQEFAMSGADKMNRLKFTKLSCQAGGIGYTTETSRGPRAFQVDWEKGSFRLKNLTDNYSMRLQFDPSGLAIWSDFQTKSEFADRISVTDGRLKQYAAMFHANRDRCASGNTDLDNSARCHIGEDVYVSSSLALEAFRTCAEMTDKEFREPLNSVNQGELLKKGG